MNDGDIAMVLRDCILVMLKLGGPPLMVALVVGLLTRRIYTQLGTTSVGQLASLRER